MDFSILSSGYETIVGFLSKLRDTISASFNFIEKYTNFINLDGLGDLRISFNDLISQAGISQSDLSRLIPIQNTSNELIDYINGVRVSDVTYIKFGELLHKARDIYLEIDNPQPINLYLDPSNETTIGELDIEEVVGCITETRTLLENTISTCDNILAATESGVDDPSLIIDRITNGVTSNYKDVLHDYMVTVLTSMSGRLSNEGLSAVISAALGFFGFDMEHGSQGNGVEGCFTNTSPANAWFGEFVNWCATAGYDMGNWLTRHPFFVYEGIGYVLYGLFKLVQKGLSIASAFIGEWAIKSVLAVTGLTGAITGSTATGDGTIGNAHAAFSVQFTNEQQTYIPSIANYLYDKNADLLPSYTVFTPGAKRFYLKDSGKWQIKVFWKMLNPFKIKSILDAHNIHLPYMFKTDEHGKGVGLIIPDPDYNLGNITNSQWLNLWADLAAEDLTYSDARINTNAAYAAGIFYAKFMDLLYLSVLAYETEVEYASSTIGSYDIQRSMEQYASRTLCVYNETGNFGNLWMVTYCCRLFDNGYPNGYDYVSDFDEDNGIIARDLVWGPVPNTGWYELQLMPLVYLADVKGTQGFWMSYLPRISNARASFNVNNDSEVSWDAGKTLLTGIAVAAAVVAAVYGIKYIPKFITYRRQLGMKLDTAAFNYGDKQTTEAYNTYKKLRLKAKLLGITTSSAESIIGTGKSLITTITTADSSVKGTINDDGIQRIAKLIAG